MNTLKAICKSMMDKNLEELKKDICNSLTCCECYSFGNNYCDKVDIISNKLYALGYKKPTMTNDTCISKTYNHIDIYVYSIGLNNPTLVSCNGIEFETQGLSIDRLVDCWRNQFNLEVGGSITAYFYKKEFDSISKKAFPSCRSVRELLEENCVEVKLLEANL